MSDLIKDTKKELMCSVEKFLSSYEHEVRGSMVGVEDIYKNLSYVTGRVFALKYLDQAFRDSLGANSCMDYQEANDMLLSLEKIMSGKHEFCLSENKPTSLFEDGVLSSIREETEALKFLLDKSESKKQIRVGEWCNEIAAEKFDANFFEKYFKEKVFNEKVKFENKVNEICQNERTGFYKKKLKM